MVNWNKAKDRFSTWAFRTPESQLVKFSRINPAYPFDRRDTGVYVFNKIRTNFLSTATILLIVCIVYFLFLATDWTNYTRLDSIFFPAIGTLIALRLFWRNLWTHTIVLNYPCFRYEYYIGEQIVAAGPVVDVYVRLKVLFAGEEDFYYTIVLGATNVPELNVVRLSIHGDLFRTVAKRLARTLNLNYFDISDLSNLHECRHATSRHVDMLLKKKPTIHRVLQQEIENECLVHKLDRFRQCGLNPLDVTDSACAPNSNWPFVKVDDVRLDVPLQRVKKLRAEKRAKETWAWRFRQIPRKLRELRIAIKISLIGRSNDDSISVVDQRHNSHHVAVLVEEEELDEREKNELICELEEVETNAAIQRCLRPFLKLRVGSSSTHYPLSVDQRAMMRLVAQYMALRSWLRRIKHEVSPMAENLSFMVAYTLHKSYSRFYKAAVEELQGGRRRRRFGCCPPSRISPT